MTYQPMLKRQSEDESPAYFGDGIESAGRDGNANQSWWWSSQGTAVRLVVTVLITFALFAFFVGGFFHAQRRQRKGLQPLAYHRWMVRRPCEPRAHDTERCDLAAPSHGMQGYLPPPPSYVRYEAPPPVYTPPDGRLKAFPGYDVTELYPQGGIEESNMHGAAAVAVAERR